MKRVVLWFSLWVLAASGATPADGAAISPGVHADNAGRAAGGEAACAAPQALADRLRADRLMLMGEVHGTQESPAAFGAAVCRALAAGRSVSVGLELNRDQVAPLAAFLASDGGKQAVARLLGGDFWTRAFQDGRSSQAMLALVQRLRTMAHEYPDLAVFILEDDAATPRTLDGVTRGQAMAARVRTEYSRRPHALILTLSGNIHNSLTARSRADNGATIPPTMGSLLADLSPTSVLLESIGGSAWVCAPTCGVRHLPVFTGGSSGAISVYRELPPGEAYSGEWQLGPSTASRPAVPVSAD